MAKHKFKAIVQTKNGDIELMPETVAQQVKCLTEEGEMGLDALLNDYAEEINENTEAIPTKENLIKNASAKTSLVDNDTVPLSDSAASNATKKITFSNIKASLKSYFDGLYNNYVHPSDANTRHVTDTQIAGWNAKAAKGDKGDKGDTGKGISSTAITYQVHSNGTSAPTDTWSSSVPSTSAGQFLWTRIIITYTDGATATFYSVSRNGSNGAQGAQGIQGIQGAKGDKGDKGDTGATGANGMTASVATTTTNGLMSAEDKAKSDKISVGSIPNTNSIALGYYSSASGDSSTALGYNSNASGTGSTALGRDSNANGTGSTALGRNSNTSGTSSTALGYYSSARNSYSIALGYNSNASSTGSTALGRDSNASGSFSIALGYYSSASGDSSTALGYYASTADTDKNTIQLGNASTLAVLRCKVSLTVTSDERDKADIKTIEKGLDFINLIEPIQYVSNPRNLYEYTTDIEETRDIEEINDTDTIESINDEIEEINDNIDKCEDEMQIDEYKREIEKLETKKTLIEKYGIEEIKHLKQCISDKVKYGLGGYDKQAHKKAKKKGERKRVGVSAQQVQEALKEIYGTADYANIVNDNLHDVKDVPDGIESQLTVAYTEFIPFLIQAVQTLSAKNDELSARIDILEGNING